MCVCHVLLKSYLLTYLLTYDQRISVCFFSYAYMHHVQQCLIRIAHFFAIVMTWQMLKQES